MDKFKIFLCDKGIEHQIDADMKRKTWIKTGGVASVWVTPTSVDELIEVGQYLHSHGLNFEIVGYTSNTFFTSGYNPGIVISTVKLRQYRVDGGKVLCDCGVKVSAMARDLAGGGYTGYYGLVDLPGTIAAAVYNNASCYGCSVSSHLESIQILTTKGELQELSCDDLHFEHRNSDFKRHKIEGIILRVTLKLSPAGDIAEQQAKSAEVHALRQKEQHGPAKNLGSVYAKLKLRRNLRNFIFLVAYKLTNYKCAKRLSLFMYGYTHLNRYVSDKCLNTFVWFDGDAEQLFEEYNAFMHAMHEGVVREIEIKD